MTEPRTELDATLHRQLAVDLFNWVWTQLERTDRTPADNDAMLHAAHASRHHWGIAGTGLHWARGEWQVSRVYAVLQRSEPARYHAQRCLDLCEAHSLADFDLAFAYEALARAAALAADVEACSRFLTQARAAGEQIAETEDRELFFRDLGTI